MLDLARFSHLSFDCYGTLIDWESGILGALRPILERHGVELGDGELLGLYAELEEAAEAPPYRPYREVLAAVVSGLGDRLGFAPTAAERAALADSAGSWPPFPDTVDALARLQARYKLAILSNVDDDIFRQTVAGLGVELAEVVTAEQVGSYKPALGNFERLIERLAIAPDRLLHVAQSLFHDHVPAKRIGLATVWVNRPSRRPGIGATPPATAAPDLEVPDLASLALAAGL